MTPSPFASLLSPGHLVDVLGKTAPATLALAAAYGAVRMHKAHAGRAPIHPLVAQRVDLVEWHRGLAIALTDLAECCNCTADGAENPSLRAFAVLLDTVDSVRRLDQLGKRGTEWPMARHIESIEKSAAAVVAGAEQQGASPDVFRATAYASTEVVPTIGRHLRDLMHNRGLGL
jgi:hypothetical protein